MTDVHLPHNFKPRPYQRRFMGYLDHHAQGGRAVWVVHRRGGKDLTAMHQTCKMAHERVGTYWHVFPTAEQGRRSIWTEFTKDGERIMEQVFPAAIRKSPRDWSPQAEMVVELKCGSIWRLMGSDKIEVAGAGPVGVVFSEYALAKPKTWDFVRPMVRERDGWVAFVSTPRGRNHLWDRWEEAGREVGWWRDLKTIHDTRAFDPERTIAEELAAGMPPALVRQEYECDWSAANIGSVYGDLVEALEKRGGISAFDHPSDGIHTVWDLGISDATAIWFFRVGEHRVPDVVDYYEATGKPLSHFMDVVDGKGYRYVKHWPPHDARARTLQTGVSTLELMVKRWGVDRVAITPELSVADGIQAGRWLLQQPIRVHARCADGVEVIRAYHYAWDEDRKVFSRSPEHDWSSHGADAWRGLACVVRASEFLSRPSDTPKGPPRSSWTMDEAWEHAPRKDSGRI